MTGVDIIEIERIRAASARASFLRGVFTERELRYWETHGKSVETLAGLWCAKEATVKALGCGFRFRPTAVEILHTPEGAPAVVLHGKAAERFAEITVEVSISHCKAYAVAVAIGKKKEKET